jgi:hypothetical protein
MRRIVLLTLCVLPALAGTKRVVDEVHPRSPGTPLEIEYRPYFCAKCLAEKRIEGEPEQIRMMRMPVEKLVEICEVGRKWLAVRTPHFKILTNLRRAKVKLTDSTFIHADLLRLKTIFPKLAIGSQGAVLNAHQRAHLYHIRVERVYSHFRALTKNDKKLFGMEAPYELYLFDDYNEHHILNDKYTGRSNDKAAVQHHIRDKPNFMMVTLAESQHPGGDRAFSNAVIHNVAHNLADGFGNYYRETWAFLEEGLAHYYERRESPRFNTFCWTEGRQPTLFQKPNWEATILNLVRRGKDTPISEWCEKVQPGELTGIEQGVCWSIVKWMVETDPIRFTKMIEKLQDYKNKPTGAECIQFAFGVSPSTLHARWREYVLEEYAKKR